MEPKASRTPERRSKRLLWFILIYVASLAAFAALVYGLRGLVPR